ncbi:elongation factor-like GTPase 1 [Asterias rubens]|uniref:elongation factor-like GTPase 1 n=1 Tax=Asterias rubens TaxID=7604 RepID=UPI001455A426|nr:elongation factor-like GTPase 1 [Asterias rubens]
MRGIGGERLARLQENAANIRNICILAHVDHGKTTLADTLISSNGIISSRMAGKLRYMDSRKDEQLRGITMKSSAISLHYNKDDQDYLINLIDSPGHVDFSSEVSTATRLCDGALIVVDVVEGVCPQTHVVLRQAWLEHITPCLVLNKIDRLISELKYTPLEAHLRLQQVLEQVNAVVGNLFASGVLEQATQKNAEKSSQPSDSQGSESNGEKILYDWSDGLEETDDSNLYFSPDQGNVIFASAIDGWGFGIDHFADMYATKLGVKVEILRKTLWGDFFLNSKTKRIMKGAQVKGKKPMFVQFILENLWSVYDTVLVKRDKDKMQKIIGSLNLKIPARDLRHNDCRVHLQAICGQWLPLSEALLAMVCQKLPSPLDINLERIEKLMCGGFRRFDTLPQQSQQLKSAFERCISGDDAPVIVYVSKMFAVENLNLPKNKPKPLSDEELQKRHQEAKERHALKVANQMSNTAEEPNPDIIKVDPSQNGIPLQDVHVNKPPEEKEEDGDTFLAFARVFSGRIRKGQKLLVLGPKHDPMTALLKGDGASHSCGEGIFSGRSISEFVVNDLYLLMGRELELMDSVPAGNVLGIGGLEGHVLKSATVSSTVACPAFTTMTFDAAPIVRVAVEPKHLADMPALVNGMKLLNQSDPCVEVLIQETGEHVIVAAGEVHLERCLDDLRERFAKIEIKVSEPIVPFRETIIIPPKIDMVNEAIDDINQVQRTRSAMSELESEISKDGSLTIKTANKLSTFKLRALPLPEEVTKLLDENTELIKILDRISAAWLAGKTSEEQGGEKLTAEALAKLLEFRDDLETAFANAGKKWRGAVDRIWSFGPKHCGPNLLLNRIDGYDRPTIWQCLGGDEGDVSRDCAAPRVFDNSVVSGFQIATFSGPLCEEPMMGVCFAIENWLIEESTESNKFTFPADKDVNNRINNGVETQDTVPRQSENVAIPVRNVDSTSNIMPELSSPGLAKSFASDCSSPLIGSPDVNSELMPHFTSRGYGPLSGQIISTVKEGCRIAFQIRPQRLMAAMYKCDIQATADVLGRMYGVVSRRHGNIQREEMREGSAVFDITATLPVAESFGFAEEIRKKTSGSASPQLFFSHWEVVPSDPFWEPSTEEELLHFGDKADYENQSRKYMNGVRRRKGLYVEKKTVEHAEKQRTLTRNK